MKLPTLAEFIQNATEFGFPKNSYVREPGFKVLYVRHGTRYIKGLRITPVLDIANAQACYPGRGAFKSLLIKIERDHPHLNIYVENVLTYKFADGLERLGFEHIPGEGMVSLGAMCYFKAATSAPS